METNQNVDTVKTLNELLRGELSAVETYEQAMSLLEADTRAQDDLRECQTSHRDRVLRLRAEILSRGAQPSKASGPWGMFAKAIEASAKVIGPRMAITALEAGEEHGLREYGGALAKLDISARHTVSLDLYPQQVRTHQIMSTLKSNLAPPVARVM